MEGYIVIVVFFGIILCLLLVGLFFYNRLLLFRKSVLSAFMPVERGIMEMRDVTLEMIEFISNNLEHEEDYLKKLEHVVLVFSSVCCENGGIEAFKREENTYLDFSKLDLVYSKLGKNSEYKEIQRKSSMLLERVHYSFSSYDERVRWYRDNTSSFIYSFLISIRKLAEFDLYDE